MEEKETKTAQTTAPVVTTETEKTVSTKKVNPKLKSYLAAFLVVAVFILGIVYLLEKEGRAKTNIFGAWFEKQEAGKVVAVVNGEDVTNAELDTTIQQFGQAAAAQGVDLTDPQIQSEIKAQATEVLINTTLLKQAAADRGITVTEADVEEKLESITNDIGGEEVLAERMEALGITEKRLYEDVTDEIIIQMLLDEIFVEAGVAVTEEEVIEFYEGAGGAEAGLPPIEEVRLQIEDQIKAVKEQQAIDEYLASLKADAEIETY